MNIREFSALKNGDKIENHATGSSGEVVECRADGVSVVWGPRHDKERRLYYSVMSTAWMQWTLPERVESPPLAP